MATARAAAKSGKNRPQPNSVDAKIGAPEQPTSPHPQFSFRIVMIGASARGLAAFTALLKALPSKSGMAFVLVQHFERDHESSPWSLLSKATSMPVVQVSNGMPVEPNHVYVSPPNKSVTILGGVLRLTPQSDDSGPQHPIDDFSISLAEEQHNLAVGVILSGVGSDGASGLKAIKSAGGVTFAQNPKTAQYSAMPMAAIMAGSVDLILSPKRIAAELARIGRTAGSAEAQEMTEGDDLDKIFLILRSSVGVDFRLYRQSIVRRRMMHRMALQKIPSLRKYAQILKQSPEEIQALMDAIFLHMSGFFRNPESYHALPKRVLTRLDMKSRAGDSIRVWVPGCSTGEELYSIAMLLVERLGTPKDRNTIQIFGTDIRDHAVERARAGFYTETAVSHVSPARLKRFFVKVDNGYQIEKFVRDLCVFARHNLAVDPPFSKLDLISCRNVLVYMSSPLQKKILTAFRFALNPGGFLLLGNSESISGCSELFTVEDRKQRIFLRKPSTVRQFQLTPGQGAESSPAATKALASNANVDFGEETQRILLERYAPPAVVIDADLRIVRFQGNTSPYLRYAEGSPNFNLLKMVRPEFVVDLRMAVYKAWKEGVSVRRDGVQFENDGQTTTVRLEVVPLKKRSDKRRDLLVVFQKVEPPNFAEAQKAGVSATQNEDSHREEELKNNLAFTREHLQALIMEHETAQEQMITASEEIASNSEELQSTNEELATAKEELQCSNEELVTLADELQHRNDELKLLTEDLNDLLVGVEIPVLLLDSELRIKWFTPLTAKLLNLIKGDVGRPFSDIASHMNVANWDKLFSEVTDRGRIVEQEVKGSNGHQYLLRLRPYKVNRDKLGGVLVVLLDMDVTKQALDEARGWALEAHLSSESILNSLTTHVAVLGPDGTIVATNNAWNRFAQKPGAVHMMAAEPGANYLHLCLRAASEGDSYAQAVLDGTRSVLQGDRDSFQFEYPCRTTVGECWFLVAACPLDGGKGGAVITHLNITDRKLAEIAAERSQSMVRALLDSSSQAVVAMNSDGTIVMVNGNTLKLFGYTREELLGQSLDILVPGIARGRRDQPSESYFGSIRSRLMDIAPGLQGRRKDETDFPVEVALSAIETDAGNFGTALISDISQRTQMEQAARKQLEADLAKEKLETVGSLAEGIAHDFNNLLAAVLAHSELAKAELAEGLSPKEELQKIETMVLHGTEIVRQLMIYAGQESEAFEIISISGIVENMLALLKVSTSKHVTVQSDLRKDLPAVRANPSQIRQMVMNLFSNASDAIGDRNGVICMTAGQVTVGPNSSLSTAEGLAPGNYVQLEISDTGRGMTPEVQARIFEPFFTTKTTGSHGQGLVVVKRIVDGLHGFIWVSSAPGWGTTFQILLPCETSPMHAIPALITRPHEGALESQPTILVVEDEDLLREAVSKILRKNNLSVLEVSDGSAALDMIRRQQGRIDVLLLDITLPGASSRQVYEEAKRLKPGLPVIVTSAKSRETAGSSLATEIEHFLRKPFSTVDLLDMIHKLVTSRVRVANQ